MQFMKRRRVIATTVIGSIGFVAIALFVGLHQNLRSSPTETRYGESGFSYLDQHKQGVFFAIERTGSFEMPGILEIDEHIAISIPRNHSLNRNEEYDLAQLSADADNSVQMPNGESLNLTAFAVVLPGGHDSFEVYDAKTYAPLPESSLRERMFNRRIKDAGELTFEPKRPILRLGFRGSHRHNGLCLIEVFDARTEFHVLKEAGYWTGGADLQIVDLELEIWHDTSLKIAFDFLAGVPIRKTISANDKLRSIPLTSEASIHIYALEKGRFVDLLPGNIWRDGATTILHKGDEDGFSALYEITPSAAAEQSYVQWAHLGVHGNNGYDSRGGIRYVEFDPEAPLDPFAKTPLPKDAEPLLEVVHYPERVRVWFRLHQLPGMPNDGDETTDLFDVRMTLNPNKELNVYHALSMAAAAAEVNYLGEPVSFYGVDIMPELNSTVVTPRQLLEVYLNLNPNKRLIVDRNHELQIDIKRDWRHEIQQRWDRFWGRSR
ncbi:MAG: hypothetical protein AAF585_14515 [Verrucomicrobiota bacterium]